MPEEEGRCRSQPHLQGLLLPMEVHRGMRQCAAAPLGASQQMVQVGSNNPSQEK
jgi:hypothetical protein